MIIHASSPMAITTTLLKICLTLAVDIGNPGLVFGILVFVTGGDALWSVKTRWCMDC